MFSKFSEDARRLSMPITVPIAFAAFAIAACASTTYPYDTQLAKAEQSIALAEESGGSQYAQSAMSSARDNLQAARTAVENDNDLLAYRHAKQAELDAEYAMAMADRMQAEEALDEVRESIETLRQETIRNSDQQEARGGR